VAYQSDKLIKRFAKTIYHLFTLKFGSLYRFIIIVVIVYYYYYSYSYHSYYFIYSTRDRSPHRRPNATEQSKLKTCGTFSKLSTLSFDGQKQ